MTYKDIIMKSIRGWLPEEPKMPNIRPKNLSIPVASNLRFTVPLKIVYSLTLGSVVAWFLFFYLSYCLGDLGGTGTNVFSVFLRYLPFLFVMSALPLAIFTLIFLTKGAGIAYFRSWNAGKKLPLSALTLLIGYVFVVFTPNTSVFPLISPNHYDFYYTYFGLILIATGFISLLLYKRQASSNGETSTSEIKWKRKKIILVFSLILIISILIGGYHLKIQRENYYLQQNYEFLRRGFPSLVNDKWTDNVGVDSNYVNYQGALFNSGRDKIYNATILVRIKSVNNTVLERVEFFIGEIRGWDYQAFDFNIEYSGEVTDVLGSYSWDWKED